MPAPRWRWGLPMTRACCANLVCSASRQTPPRRGNGTPRRWSSAREKRRGGWSSWLSRSAEPTTSVRTAREYTNAPLAAPFRARDRCRMCPMDGSARFARASSMIRPTVHNGRAPHRRIRSRSEGGDSESRPAARACIGRLSPGRGRRGEGCAAGSLGGFRWRTLRLDLVDRVDHRVEGEQRGGMPRLVVAHGFEHPDVGPLAIGGGGGGFLLPLSNGVAQDLEFV